MCSHNGLLNDCDNCARSLAVLAGSNGLPGANGLKIISGTGVPSVSLGVDDELYLDLNSPRNLYKKVSGAWVFMGQMNGYDGNGFFIQKEVTVTSAEILLLSSVHKTLVPGIAGYYHEVISSVANMDVGAAPYVIGSNSMFMSYATTGEIIAEFRSIVLGSSTDTIVKSAAPVINCIVAPGSAIELYQFGSNPTLTTPGTGGTVKIQFVYHTWAV